MIVKPLVAAALALGSVAIVPATGAQHYGDGEPRYEQPYRQDYWQQASPPRGYGPPGRGYGYERPGYDQRGYDARRDRRCSSGTTGAILGALAGGLLGRSVDARGDRATGTIVGAGGGALAGRAIEKSNNSGYCR